MNPTLPGKMLRLLALLSLALIAASYSRQSRATELTPSLSTVDPAAAHAKRQKVIDFEDEVVEGLNKRPLDSLSQISDRDKRRRRPHLYRKRTGFRTELAESLRLLRYTAE